MAVRLSFRSFCTANGLLAVAAFGVILLWAATYLSLRPLPENLADIAAREALIADRYGKVLGSFSPVDWNTEKQVALWQVPPFLIDAMLQAEDKRFFEHGGTDWLARASALKTNILSGKTIRGASTITEQVVKMLHPRPRTVWSRWLEGIEAGRLSKQATKAEVLEFYLNQLPYSGNRRGILEAARYYFDRDLSTLNKKEMLALVVLVRAPSRLDLRRHPGRAEGRVIRLAQTMHKVGLMDKEQLAAVETDKIRLSRLAYEEKPEHFLRYVRRRYGGLDKSVRTTLLPSLQKKTQRLLDERLRALSSLNAADGAVLVVDHERDEILAWVNSGRFFSSKPGSQVDAVLALRQPGSALKPFLYALALEHGWTAATVIDDSPYSKAVGHGLHEYNNYSRTHYGPVSLRSALGNSLNIPAVRAADYVGTTAFLKRLRDLGFEQLIAGAAHYGEGLALGNGEVTLFELVRAFAVLGRGGVYQELNAVTAETGRETRRRVYSPEVTSIISMILADPQARALEFGRNSVLQLPIATAVKTGTSNAYRDAWAVGYNRTYTVGVWMGNLDSSPMHEVSGSVGPGLVLRAVFAELARYQRPQSLRREGRLRLCRICKETGLPPSEGQCTAVDEWFDASQWPDGQCFFNKQVKPRENLPAPDEATPERVTILHPQDGLHLATDPHIPDQLEAFAFEIEPLPGIKQISWEVNGIITAQTEEPRYLWPVTPGIHTLRVAVEREGNASVLTSTPVVFTVK